MSSDLVMMINEVDFKDNETDLKGITNLNDIMTMISNLIIIIIEIQDRQLAEITDIHLRFSKSGDKRNLKKIVSRQETLLVKKK